MNSLQQNKSDLLGGFHKAVCYSGFRTGQHPDRGAGAKNPSYQEILEDLKIISDEMDFHLIRLYDCGENSEMTLKVIQENKLNIKVLLGMWIKAELSNHQQCEWLTKPIPESDLQQNKKDNLAEIQRGIALANEYKDIIIAVNVANEALVSWTDHKVHTDTIISYVKKLKQEISQKVTVAENYRWWIDYGKELAQEVDFVAAHIYPIWEGKTIEEGLSYSIENLKEIKDSLPQSKVVITEAGWATIATEFGNRASEENQMRYYNELINWTKEMNYTSFVFEAFDEDWKGDDNPLGAEKHWGLYFIDRTPKKVFQNNK